MSAYPRIAGVHYESGVDGVGIRTTVFFSGCTHHCPGCQNFDIQDPNTGKECNETIIEEIANEMLKRPFLSGLTLSGGDPLYEPQKTLNFVTTLAKYLGDRLNINNKEAYDIWIYTGYTWEELVEMMKTDKDLWMLLRLYAVRVLVDGKFIQAQADKRLAFRGSRNQRIIDVRKSLQNPDMTPVLWKRKR